MDHLTPTLPGISLLCVDDDLDARDMLCSLISARFPSLSLHMAADGEQGVAMFRQVDPDIVLTDLNMPRMDGMQMTAAIRAENADVPVIFLTAVSDTPFLIKAIELGISHYVLKPVESRQLFGVIEKCLRLVTLKRQVAAQNEHIAQLSRAVERSPSMVMITDAQGVIEYVNPKFCAVTGYTAAEVLGRNPRIFRSGTTPAAVYADLWQTLLSGAEWRGEFQNRKKGGEPYWEYASISSIPGSNGEISHFVAVKEDITGRKQADLEIRKLNVALEERAAELEEANQELEAFNYTVSHDLRRPLTNINGSCQVIRELFSSQLPPEGVEFLKTIQDEIWRMDELISTLLGFSRLGRVELRKEPVNLSKIVRELISQYRAREPERSLTVQIAEGQVAVGDQALLRVVMENLISNAWKYTGQVESPRIEFGTATVDGVPSFFVSDNGAGFDMERAADLFRPFQRLHSAEEFAGHGIGLATVKRIIQRHGGRLWAESVVGAGATFFFTL